MRKKIIYTFLILLAIIPLIVVFSNFTIKKSAENKTYFDVSKITKNKVGLVLGTSKLLKDGRINPYFKYRIDATVKLYKNAKIEFVLVSGDNGNKNYNEPEDFKNALIQAGIPEDKIYLDFAGFRTLDSVVRAKEVFGQDSITIISQKFHNERAIYLAEHYGIEAIGFNAKDLSRKNGLKTRIREYFARTKVFIDILLAVKPKFLGESIVID